MIRTSQALVGVALTALLTGASASSPANEELRAIADSLFAISRGQTSGRVWPDLSELTRRSNAARVDAIAAKLGQLDRRQVTLADDQLLYDNLAEAVASSHGTRICRYELWAATNQFSGWHVTASNWARTQRM